uniref:DDE-1 domain-containing protein n=1 Tax=Trichogramma kaykai TaxID=54128 RepID=A0ABD2WT44_9HYME
MAACHPAATLFNVKIVFLPANATAICQPLDQGGLNNIMESYTEKYKKVARGGRMRLNLPDHVRSKDFLILQAEEDLALKSSDPFITLSRELPKKKFLPLKAKMKSLLVLDGHSEEASEELVVETNRSDENDTDSETETSDTDEDSDIE